MVKLWGWYFNILIFVSVNYAESFNVTDNTDYNDWNMINIKDDTKAPILVSYISQIFCNKTAFNYVVLYENSINTTFVSDVVLNINNCKRATLEIHEFDVNISNKPYNENYLTTRLLIVMNQPAEDYDFDYLAAHSADKGNSYHILVIEHVGTDKSWIDRIFARYWSKQFLNILVIFINEFNKITALTYNPFKNNEIVNIPVDDMDFEVILSRKLYDLNGVTLKVCLFPEESRVTFKNGTKEIATGTDGAVTLLLADKMNFTVQVEWPRDGLDFGELKPNGSGVGSVGMVLNKEVDLGLNLRFLRGLEFVNKIEASIVIGRDDLCFLVPVAGEAPMIWNIFRSFDIVMWLLIVIMIPFMGTLFYMFSKYYGLPPDNFYLKALAGNLSQGFSEWSSKSTIRMLIALWLIYGMIIIYSYTANLVSNILLKINLPNVDTISDLALKTDYKIAMFERYVRLINEHLINGSGRPEYHKFNGRLVGLDISVYNKHINNDDTQYAYMNKDHVNNFKLSNAKEVKFHQVKECPIPYVTAYIAPFGSPYLSRVNIILERLIESGILDFWDYTFVKSHSRALAAKQVGDHAPLSLMHMQTGFYILGVGLLCAFFAFIYELLKAQRMKKRTQARCIATL